VRIRWTAAVFVVAAALLAAACGGDGEGPSPTLVTTTTVPVTAPPPPALKFTTPKQAIDHMILQWQAGDREAAGQAASAEAVAALFAKPSKAVQFRNCDISPSPNLGSDCVYRYEPGLIRLHLTVTAGDWKVATVTYEGV
jgi:hypothetical protein